jgi:signal transduction histidine kinase/putative methionine-R-sulfoxide reductase with GAF domain
VTGQDELASLSRIFNEAARQLAAQYANLEETVRQRSEELDRRAGQLQTSLAVVQRIHLILDLDTLLDQVVEIIKEQYGYDYVGVFLLDESDAYVAARAGTGQAGQRLCVQNFRVKVGSDNVLGWVAQYRRLERVDDVELDNRLTRLPGIEHTRSELALPLTMGKKLLGVLDIQSEQLRPFLLDDLPVLESLANQVAIAIQNSSLYQGERSRRRLSEALYEAGRAISSTLDLDDVLALILEHLAAIVDYDRAAVMLQDKSELEIVAARGFPEEMSPLQVRVTIKANDVFEEINRSGEPLAIQDVLEQRPDWEHVPGLTPARSWLGVPLIRFDKAIGMLSLARVVVKPYEKDEMTLAAAFASQAAFALENARLYDKITRFTQQLEDMVRERTEAVQAAYLQLEHLDRTKTDFINVTAHELRTPITVLQGYSRMLINDPQIQQNGHQLELITSIHSGAIRLHEVVNSMLDMAKIDNRSLALYPEPVFIPSLIELVCQQFVEPLAERNIDLRIKDMSDLPAIEIDPDALRKVFYHLIVNAIKFTPDGGNIEISGRARKIDWDEISQEGVQVEISDTGIGIDPEYQEVIFAKFYQTGELALHSSGKTKFKGAGPGLGLAIVRGIVEAHRGKVWMKSPGYDEETCPGSRFCLFLPLRQSGPRQHRATQPAAGA